MILEKENSLRVCVSKLLNINPMTFTCVPMIIYMISQPYGSVRFAEIFLFLNHQIDMSRLATPRHKPIWDTDSIFI